MTTTIDWISNSALPVGKGATRQEFDATVGIDQRAIETTPWGEGELRINGIEIARIHDAQTPLEAFHALRRFAQSVTLCVQGEEVDPCPQS